MAPAGWPIGHTVPRFTCTAGIVLPRPQVGIPFAGTHLLVDFSGKVRASLRSSLVNLNLAAGQVAIVCGLVEPEVEGVTPIRVTTALPFGWARFGR